MFPTEIPFLKRSEAFDIVCSFNEGFKIDNESFQKSKDNKDVVI